MPLAVDSKLDIPVAAADVASSNICFHCHEPVPAGTSKFMVTIDGHARPMCCPGCQAVAETIVAWGLSAYYAQRDDASVTPPSLIPRELQNLSRFDAAQTRRQYSTDSGSNTEAHLSLVGLTCAACAWLIEQRLRVVPGVLCFDVNYANRTAHVVWRDQETKLSVILAEVLALGFQAYPLASGAGDDALEDERRGLLRRTGVAALCTAQLMMLAVPGYLDEALNATAYGTVFKYLSALLSMPIVCYAALPWMHGALNAVRLRVATMDVPIAVAVVLASVGSVWSLARGVGPVYFESVAMFVTILLLTRYLETLARLRAQRELKVLQRVVPRPVTRVNIVNGVRSYAEIDAAAVELGDVILVRGGDMLAVDGTVVSGQAGVDESMVTGESGPVYKRSGDTVYAGTTVQDQSLEITVSALHSDSFKAQLAQLVARAQFEKPRITVIANRVAGWFVIAVLCIGGLATLVHVALDTGRAFQALLAVLVASCPCALAIATPTALTAASARLWRAGVALLRPNALAILARAKQVVCDKTGTLTAGQLKLTSLRTCANMDASSVLAVVAALEQHSQHPVARAVLAACAEQQPMDAREVESEPGLGIRGVVAGCRYYCGSRRYVEAHSGQTVPSLGPARFRVWLAEGRRVLAALDFDDPLRPEAPAVVAQLRANGQHVTVLSGDDIDIVERVAAQVGADAALGERLPQEKYAHVANLQAQGDVVLALGDGLNDAPLLARADVAIAMPKAADLSKLNADIVLSSEDLAGVVVAQQVARTAVRLIHQNIAWAILYNLVAIPIAVSGALTAWQAALGMSLSSLLVVGNALRLHRVGGAQGSHGYDFQRSISRRTQ